MSIYDFATDLEANIKFFEDHKLPRIAFLNSVSDLNTKYYERFSQEEIARYNQKKTELLRRYIDLKKDGKRIPNYMKALFLPLIYVVLRGEKGVRNLFLGRKGRIRIRSTTDR